MKFIYQINTKYDFNIIVLQSESQIIWQVLAIHIFLQCCGHLDQINAICVTIPPPQKKRIRIVKRCGDVLFFNNLCTLFYC